MTNHAPGRQPPIAGVGGWICSTASTSSVFTRRGSGISGRTIPLLAAHLIGLLNEEMGWGASAISPEAMEELKNYDWPGNVRELRNVIERAMIIAKERLIRPEDLPERVRRADKGEPSLAASPAPYAGNLRRILAETERRTILEALRSAGGNKSKAAKILGIHRTSL